MNKDEICYWCGKVATSREHVPPKCLFPEDKDIKEVLGKSFRNNLVTVPSCDKHNMSKSHEDEYLMACLSGRVGNNDVAYIHNATKVKRARERNHNMIKINGVDTLKLYGKEFPVQLATIDNFKLTHSFEAIARALYFHEQNQCFIGTCKVISKLLIKNDNSNWSGFVIHSTEIIEKEQKNWRTQVKGDNTDVFTYQFSPVDGFRCQTLALTFYKSTKVYVIFSSLTQKEIEKVKPKFQFLKKVIFDDLIE